MAYFLVKHRNLLMGCLVLVTLIGIIPASQVRIDASGVSFTVPDSEDYTEHLAFVESFGTDDYILLAVQTHLSLSDPEFKKRISQAHEKLTALDPILKVIDLGTMESSPLFKLVSTAPFWDPGSMAEFHQVIPGLSRLISNDLKTLAFIVKINNETLNGFQLEKQLAHMKQIIGDIFSEHPYCYGAGIPVLRAAFERYNLLSALIFGALGLIFGILIAFYIFKTLWAGILVLVTSLGSLVWTLGIMGIFKIDLNLATGLSFGFILVVSTTTIFHIVSAYFQWLKTGSRDLALIRTFETILRPCFMCALTTSAGFFSLTISPVPMVHQAGIIIALGVMIAFFLALLITAFSLPRLESVNHSAALKSKNDFLDLLVQNYAIAGFKKPGISLLAGLLLFIVMVAGIPKIQTVKHLTNPMIKSTREARDLEYLEQHISTGTSFSIILESTLLKSGKNSFHSRKFWYDLSQFEEKIKTIPGIQGVESLTSLVFRVALKFASAGIRPEVVFQQMTAQRSEDDLLPYYLDPVSKKLRIIVHIQTRSSDQIETILKQVKDAADHTFDRSARVALSGQLLLLRSQTMDLVSSQIKTLFLALFVITLLMMVQLKSFVLGILSLIPNLFPIPAGLSLKG